MPTDHTSSSSPSTTSSSSTSPDRSRCSAPPPASAPTGRGYRTLIATRPGAPVRSESGVEIGADVSTGRASADGGAASTRCSSSAASGASPPPTTAAFLDESPRSPSGPAGSRSVCTGAFVLAAAGLLDGCARHHPLGVVRRARRAPPRRRREPRPHLRPRPRPLDVGGRDRRASTSRSPSSRRTTAPDARARGRRVARRVRAAAPAARRSSARSSRPAPRRTPSIAELQRWLPDHLDEDLGVDALAARAAMSPRNFARRLPARDGLDTGRATSRSCGSRRRAACSRPPTRPVAAVAERVGLRARRDPAPGVPPPGRHHPRPVPPALRPHELTPQRGHVMQVAIGLYEGFTALDVIGPYQVFTNVPGTEVVVCADRTGVVDDDDGLLRFDVEHTFADVPTPEILLVGGGLVTRALAVAGRADRRVDRRRPPAHHLHDVGVHRLAPARRGRRPRRARRPPRTGSPTTSFAATAPSRPRSGSCGRARSSPARACRPASTWRSPSSADIHGDEVAQAVQLGIEYDPQPPFDAARRRRRRRRSRSSWPHDGGRRGQGAQFVS